MRPIPLGAKGSFKLRVTPAHLANQFKDAMLPQVFATPMMIMAMENAALNAIRGYLDPGESAVGTAVDIRHIAATPGRPRGDGARRGHGRRRPAHCVQRERARRDREEIGNGTHARMVVDMRRSISGWPPRASGEIRRPEPSEGLAEQNRNQLVTGWFPIRPARIGDFSWESTSV
jgi:fluoroacetyl-CoA thioesterase